MTIKGLIQLFNQ